MKNLFLTCISLALFATCGDEIRFNAAEAERQKLRDEFLNSDSFKLLGIEKSQLSNDIVVQRTTTNFNKIFLKFKNSDLSFVVGKLDKYGKVMTSCYGQIIPDDHNLTSFDKASEEFENSEFDGEIIVRLGSQESQHFKFKNSKIQNTNGVRTDGSPCGFTDSLHQIGGMGWGSKIGCFLGFIGCLFWNYIDCITS